MVPLCIFILSLVPGKVSRRWDRRRWRGGPTEVRSWAETCVPFSSLFFALCQDQIKREKGSNWGIGLIWILRWTLLLTWSIYLKVQRPPVLHFLTKSSVLKTLWRPEVLINPAGNPRIGCLNVASLWTSVSAVGREAAVRWGPRCSSVCGREIRRVRHLAASPLELGTLRTRPFW